MPIRNASLLVACLLLLFACGNEDEQLNIDSGKDYFPLTIGQQKVYRLDSIVFDQESGQQLRDTSSYLVEETLTDTFSSASGALNYRVERRIRPLDSTEWSGVQVWATSVSDREAIRQEENLSFAKLSFPLRRGLSWNGNKYLPENILIAVNEELLEVYKYWQYRVIAFDEPLQLGDLSFDKVLTIRQADEDNIIERRYALEQYARGVGLVYQQHIILDSQCGGNPADCIDTPWIDKAEKGYMLTLTLLSYH